VQALAAAVLAGAAAAVLDLLYYYPEWTAGWKLTYVVVVVASTLVVCGIGGTALVRALARTGALSSFAAGRSRV
jgi:energy-coupling factor transport system substrate-specific component